MGEQKPHNSDFEDDDASEHGDDPDVFAECVKLYVAVESAGLDPEDPESYTFLDEGGDV